MRRKGNWYNGSKANKKYKDAKVNRKDWLPIFVTQNEFDCNPNPTLLSGAGAIIVIDNAKYSKPKHEERFANINDCFPLRAIGHHTH